MTADNEHKFRNTPTASIKSLTDEDMSKFLGYFYRQDSSRKKNETSIRDRLLILLMLDGGMRVGETLSMVVSDLHLLGGPVNTITLRAETTKTKKERSVPVSMRLRDAIQEMFLTFWQPFEYQPHFRAFANPTTGKPLSKRRAEQITRSAGLASIGRPVNPHMLRHTAGYRMSKVAPLPVVQRFLGHRSITSTQIYTQPRDQDIVAAVCKLNV